MFEVGQRIYYLAYCEGGDDFQPIDEIFAESICVKRGTIKRIWKNGRIALDNGKVIFDIYCRKHAKECVASLINHVERLDMEANDICNHDFSYTDTTCNWCGILKSKV
jgi:hypothetical protein